MSQRCVTLVGCMGAGKSVVGKKLADALGYDFVDTDKMVEAATGKKIFFLFEEKGEVGFRAAESDAVKTLAGSKCRVIATGGGAVIDPQNREIFHELGYVAYLKATPRELYYRIKNDHSRPLLARSTDPQGTVARLLSERERFYREADIIIDTEDLSVEEVTDVLIDELAKRTRGDG